MPSAAVERSKRRVVRGLYLYVSGDANIDDLIQVEVHIGGGLGVEDRIGHDRYDLQRTVRGIRMPDSGVNIS